MIKTKNIHILLAASLSLASCETAQTVTKPLEPPPPAETSQLVASAPQAPIVVRSDIVPDDPEPEIVAPVVKRTPRVKPAIVTAAVTRPVVEDEPASPVTSTERTPTPAPAVAATPEVKPSAEKPTTPPALPSVATSPSVTASTTTPAVEPPPTPAAAPPTAITPPPGTDTPPATSQPAAEPPPSSLFNDPSAILKDPKAFLQAKIGGMPLWLVVLFVVLAFISLVIGFRGKKEPEPVSI